MTFEPSFGRLNIFGLSIIEIQPPIAPIVHPKMILAAAVFFRRDALPNLFRG
jgi:hypothetical protein